jgi:hypothetical protein
MYSAVCYFMYEFMLLATVQRTFELEERLEPPDWHIVMAWHKVLEAAFLLRKKVVMEC